MRLFVLVRPNELILGWARLVAQMWLAEIRMRVTRETSETIFLCQDGIGSKVSRRRATTAALLMP